MLTIKHIDVTGVETILEAERVEVVRGKGRYSDGIYLDRETGDGPVLGSRPHADDLASAQAQPPTSMYPPSHGALTFKHVIHFVEARCSEDTDPVVYVMNRFGATVATYRL